MCRRQAGGGVVAVAEGIVRRELVSSRPVPARHVLQLLRETGIEAELVLVRTRRGDTSIQFPRRWPYSTTPSCSCRR